MIEDELIVSGPLQVHPGRRRLVALVGPTGVGKTTTIAKLAATFRLREKRKVGLITVDTYRIAAVEQLRTYADIIDLPMAVVSTPREMREAVAGMSRSRFDPDGHRRPQSARRSQDSRAEIDARRSGGRRSASGAQQCRRGGDVGPHRRAIRRGRHHRLAADQARRSRPTLGICCR